MSRAQTVIYHKLDPDIQPFRELKQWYTTHYIRIYNHVENSNSDIPHTISGYTTMSRTQTVIYHTLYPDIQPCRELKQWYTIHYIRIYNDVENSNSDIPHTISRYKTMSRTQIVIYHTLYPHIQPCRELKQWYTTDYIRIYNHVENSNSDIPHYIRIYNHVENSNSDIHTLYPIYNHVENSNSDIPHTMSISRYKTMSRTQIVIYHTLYPHIQPCRELKQWYTTNYIRIYNHVKNSNSDIPHTISGYTTMSRTQTVIYHTLYPDIQPCRELNQWYTTHYIRIYNHVENSNSDIPHTISGYTTMSRTQTVIYHTLYPDIQLCRELKQWYTTHYIRIYNHVESSNSDIPQTISGYTTMSRTQTVIYHTLYPDIQPCRELKQWYTTHYIRIYNLMSTYYDTTMSKLKQWYTTHYIRI